MELAFPAGAKGNALFFHDALVLLIRSLFFLVTVAVRRERCRCSRCSLLELWMSESRFTTSASRTRAVSARPLRSALLEASVRLTFVGTAGSEEGSEGADPSMVDSTMDGGVYPVWDRSDIVTVRFNST